MPKKNFYFVTWTNFDSNKLSFEPQKQIEKKVEGAGAGVGVHERTNIQYLSPKYNYAGTKMDHLIIKSPFINCLQDPYLQKYKGGGKYQHELRIDPNNVNGQLMIEMLVNYDQKLDQFITDSYGPNFICHKRLISNRGKFYGHQEEYREVQFGDLFSMLEFRLKCQGSRIENEIYNYNVSKKYPTVEEFQSIEIKDLRRFLKKNKDIRLVFHPVSWIIPDKLSYGTFLAVDILEVKYGGSFIKSVLDADTVQSSNVLKEVNI